MAAKGTVRTSCQWIAFAMLATALGIVSNSAEAQRPSPTEKVAKANPSVEKDEPHPIDIALKRAQEGLDRIRYGIPERNIEPLRDYTCYLIKRERINGKLSEVNVMFCKFRNRHVDPQTGSKIPFSVYMRFEAPAAVKGREAIWVEGKNNGKLCAHEANSWLPTVWLDPKGALAMRGQLYPISEAGLESMVQKLLKRGAKERQYPADECEVTFRKGVSINKIPCTLLTISHSVRRPEYEFSKAHVFIHDELELPVRYVAYDWPKPGQEVGDIQEEYTHIKIKVNVGLTDMDFDPANKEYKFK